MIIICAYNEERTLPNLLAHLEGPNVLVLDDGSSDNTGEIARAAGAAVISHPERQGKVASLSDAIRYAKARRQDIVVEIDADSIPTEGSIDLMVEAMKDSTVGACAAKQVPVGRRNPAYFIDEVLWGTMTHAKRIQVARFGSCYLGGAMIAFRPQAVTEVGRTVNDDERIGIEIRKNGLRIVFLEGAVALSDASVSLGHLIQRQTRYAFGHLIYPKSAAPSMSRTIYLASLLLAVMERPSRFKWALPAALVAFYCRVIGWRDMRKGNWDMYLRWVTTYVKNAATSLQ